jgi:membrane protease YdiL (CAAX protease family)
MTSLKRVPVTAYFVLAFLFSWAITAVMIARYKGSLDAPGWLHYLVAWGPALAALVVTGLTEGLSGIRTLIGRVFRWQIGGRDWLIAAGSPLLLLAAAVLISAVTTGAMPDLSRLGVVDYLGDIGIPAALIVWCLSFGLGEEIGWRGFAQQQLEPKRGLLVSTLWIGVIWACWHLPHFFYKDTFIQMGLAGFPFYVVNIVPGAIVLGWLYSRTKSILAVAVWHGLFDFATASAVDGGTVSMVMSIGVMMWALLIVVAELRGASKRRTLAVQR